MSTNKTSDEVIYEEHDGTDMHIMDIIMRVGNVYVKYYNEVVKLNPDGTHGNHHLFEDIDYSKEDSTNDIMESLYAEIIKYNMAKSKAPLLDYSRGGSGLYILSVNGNPVKMCSLLFPLIIHMSEIEWHGIEWTISPPVSK